MSTKTIVASFDLDGVCYDFAKAFGAFAGFTPDLSQWDMGIEGGQEGFRPIYERFVESGEFRYGDPLVDSAKIRALRDIGVKVVYTTARREDARPETQAWLTEHGFPGLLIMSDDKAAPMALFDHRAHEFWGVDDSGKNAVRMHNVGMVSYLVDYEHNRETQQSYPGIRVVQGVEDFCYNIADQFL